MIDWSNSTSNYTYGSSGNAVAVRFIMPKNSSIRKVYFHVLSGVSGESIEVEIRNTTGTDEEDVGSTSYGSASVEYISDDTWHVAELDDPVSFDPGDGFYVVLGASGASAWTISNDVSNDHDNYDFMDTRSTSDGWSSSSVGTGNYPIVLEFNDGTVWGMPWTGDSSSLTSKKWGINLEYVGTTYNIWGVTVFGTSMTNLESISLKKGNSGPNGPDEKTVDATDVSNGTGTYLLDFEIEAGIGHRIIFEFSSSVSINANTMSSPRLKSVLDAGNFGGRHYLTVSNGSSWVDYRDVYPQIFVGINGIT